MLEKFSMNPDEHIIFNVKLIRISNFFEVSFFYTGTSQIDFGAILVKCKEWEGIIEQSCYLSILGLAILTTFSLCQVGISIYGYLCCNFISRKVRSSNSV
jgi:hypothetical protein